MGRMTGSTISGWSFTWCPRRCCCCPAATRLCFFLAAGAASTAASTATGHAALWSKAKGSSRWRLAVVRRAPTTSRRVGHPSRLVEHKGQLAHVLLIGFRPRRGLNFLTNWG